MDGGSSSQLSFNTANNQIIGYSYDAAGNMTYDGNCNYTYDAEGNILTVYSCQTGTPATYVYNALNQRVQTTVGGTITGYVYNSAGQRVSEWNGTTNAEIEGKYYWGGKPVAFYSGSVTHFEHQDWLGTERMRTTYNGGVEGTYTSLPFGDAQTTAGTDTDPYHYAQLDSDYESGTDHAQFRQYSDAQGRWLSPDPYSGSYDAFNPQSFNRYVYVGNNPLSATDPSGLYRAAPCMGGSQCNNGYTGNPLDPSGSSQGLSGYFTIAVPTATWVYGQEVPYGDYIPAHWVYGWTYATFSLNNSSPSGPSPVGPGAPNTTAPSNGPTASHCAGVALKKNGVSLALDAASFGVGFLPGGGAVRLVGTLVVGSASTGYSAATSTSFTQGAGNFANGTFGTTVSTLAILDKASAVANNFKALSALPILSYISTGISTAEDAAKTYQTYSSCMAGQ